MHHYPNSAQILERNRRFLPGGVASVNRSVKPEIVFVKAEGARLWDADGHQYIDYHAAFAPHLLGHNDPYVNEAVRRILSDGTSLFGSGTTILEGRLAELICAHVPGVEAVQLMNTGSEATSQAIRVARAATGRSHIVVMQGGYNGWHDDVCCNLMTPLAELGPRVSPGEYPYISLSGGVPEEHRRLVHPVNFNDLESVEFVCDRYPVAGVITEPILQEYLGVVQPRPGYLQGLRELADRRGLVLIFDEVKTGFRHALGGYASLCGVTPDLVTYGKALANGYPMAALGGRKELLDYFVHPDPKRRVLLAGTYNAHPVPTAAAIATLERLLMNNGEVHRRLESLGAAMERGIAGMLARKGVNAVVARQGSAFCIYFMDHLPVDWHDLASNHDFHADEQLRLRLIEAGVYVFPLATKQCSISFAHSTEDVERTLEALDRCLEAPSFEARA